MKFDRNMLLLYAVTDRSWVGRQTLYEQIEEALQGGVTIVQLREKTMSDDEFIAEAVEIRKLCHRYSVPLIINDRVDVALKSGADGVHVGIEDAPVAEIRKRVPKDFIIGATAKTIEQALIAESSGADYLGVGAVFPSPTKKNAIRITTSQLHDICASVKIPAVAIGGISLDNVHELNGGGMNGIAVVSAIFGAENIREASRKLRNRARSVTMKPVLTIAGSDSSGGAGIQADIKTMTANGVYAMSAVTALTAQNTMGVTAISEVTPEFMRQQLDSVFTDIPPCAVKTGMLASSELIDVIAERLTYYKAENIVVDPVMVSTSGSKLLKDDAVSALTSKLLPIASLVTPNIPEAEILSGMKIQNKADMTKAAEYISKAYGCAVLLKGGHSIGSADDLLCDDGGLHWFEGRKISNQNTHGTGCTLSSAIASNLAKGYDMVESVMRAKEYISGALEAFLNLGHGSGPLDHGYGMAGRFLI